MTKKVKDFIWMYLIPMSICDLIITYYKKKHNDPDIISKYEKTIKKGYLMDMQLIQTIVITAVSVFMVVQLLNNIVPKWKEYVGLTND